MYVFVCLYTIYITRVYVVVWMKVVSYCYTLAGYQNPPLPVVAQSWITAVIRRKHSSDKRLFVCVLAYTEADANEDVCQLYSWADVCALIWLTVVTWFIKMLHFVENMIKSNLNECQSRGAQCLSGTKLTSPQCNILHTWFENEWIGWLTAGTVIRQNK